MKLRKLKLKDAPYMLEWMHDDSVVHDLNKNFSVMTIDDCNAFINNSVNENHIHMAIVDDEDQYMGTVSLKKINYEKKTAEFGITIRSVAMRKGYSIFAMRGMLGYAYQHGIQKVFWCVSPRNERALKFYDKNSFQKVSFKKIGSDVGYPEDKIKEFVWYQDGVSI